MSKGKHHCFHLIKAKSCLHSRVLGYSCWVCCSFFSLSLVSLIRKSISLYLLSLNRRELSNLVSDACASLRLILFLKYKPKPICHTFWNCIVRLLPLWIKSINPMRRYPHIIESQACIRKMFVMIFLLLKNLSISPRMCSPPNLSKDVTLLLLAYKTIQCVPVDYSHQYLLCRSHPSEVLVDPEKFTTF